MARPPYMNFPFPFYKGYPRRNPINFQNPQRSQINNVQPAVSYSVPNTVQYSAVTDFPNNRPYFDSKEGNCKDFKQKNKSNKYTDDYLFDLFGLKIYNDDVLLVSLIYFLYSEGVKDDGLFIVLILLLLS